MLCGHDPRHGYADPLARPLSPPLRNRHARSQRASRFLEEVPRELMQDLGSPRRPAYPRRDDYGTSTHYSYEDEDQRPQYATARSRPKRSLL